MSNTTCWTVIDAAAAGSRSDREAFAKSYLHAIHAYFRARWRESRLMDSLDDAVQEVFLECFRDDGPLARVDRDREGGFRPFLYGVVRNIALRIEKRAATAAKRIGENVDLARVISDESRLSVQFDRAWALTVVRRAAKMQEDLSHKKGDAARRRVELLKLRFQDGIPIREIAVRWGQDPAILHREYAKARQEFKQALMEIVAFHHPGDQAAIERECALLLEIVK